MNQIQQGLYDAIADTITENIYGLSFMNTENRIYVKQHNPYLTLYSYEQVSVSESELLSELLNGLDRSIITLSIPEATVLRQISEEQFLSDNICSDEVPESVYKYRILIRMRN